MTAVKKLQYEEQSSQYEIDKTNEYLEINQKMKCEVCDTEEERELSNNMLSLIKNKKIIGFRILLDSKKELMFELEGGTRLFIDRFQDKNDVAILKRTCKLH